MTVVVWKVNPFVKDCLTQQLSLHYGQPQVYLAAMGHQLALTFQEPNSGSYSLKHFNLLSQSQTEYQPTVGHSGPFTGHRDFCIANNFSFVCCVLSVLVCLHFFFFFAGLCVLPDHKLFVSSSLDKTVCIWNEENHLIRLEFIICP